MYISIMIFPAVLVINFSCFTAKSLFRKRPFFFKGSRAVHPGIHPPLVRGLICFLLGGMDDTMGDAMIMSLPGLVNVNKKRWNITMLFSWVNPLFRLGHFQSLFVTNYQAGS